MSFPSKPINLYQRFALDWDRERDRSLSEKDWLDRFLAILLLKPSISYIGYTGTRSKPVQAA
jgi:hypothetical protein